MAGSEQAGIRSARIDLFRGATWVFTLPPGQPRAALDRLAHLAEALGAHPVEMDAAAHDRAVARISHLPHVAAAALAAAALAGGEQAAVLRQLAAGGFRDTTRVAASQPEMWRDVCLSNAAPILEALRDCEGQLARFRDAIERRDERALLALFTDGARARARVLPSVGESGVER